MYGIRLFREPFTLATGLGIAAAAAPYVASGVNYASAGKTNKKSRKFAENMYWTERNNALEDWTRNNEYNSPSAQMARFKAAGLNPAMIYGHGAVGNAGPVANVSGPTPNTSAPQMDTSVGEKSLQGYQLGITSGVTKSLLQQNLENEKKRNELMEAQRIHELASADAASTGASQGKFKLRIDQELEPWDKSVRRSQSHISSNMVDKSFADAQMATQDWQNHPQKISQENALRIWQRNEIQAKVEQINQQVKQSAIRFPGELKQQWETLQNTIKTGDLLKVEQQIKQLEFQAKQFDSPDEIIEILNNIKSLLPSFFVPLGGGKPSAPASGSRKGYYNLNY